MRAVPEVVAAAEVDVAERLEVRDRRPAPCPRFCVEVKPRKSSDVSGIRSAPGICAASAICFGSDWPPSKPPPAKPRRIDVTWKSFESRMRFVGVVDVVARRRSAAGSRRRSARAACRRDRSGSARASSSTGLPARRSCGSRRCAASGTNRSKYGSPQATRDAEPGRRRRVVARRGRRAARSSSRCASRRSPRPTATRAVTISWWSGGTSTSTPSECTTRMPSSRCCSGSVAPRRRALRRAAGQLVDELVDAGRADGAGRGADDDLPAA